MGSCYAKPAEDDINGYNNNEIPFPANRGNQKNKKKPTSTTMPPSLSGIAATATMATDITNNNNSTTAALLKPILSKIVFPIVEYVASVSLVKDKMILWDEKLMEEKDVNISNLPLAPIDLALENVTVVDLETLYEDQIKMPEFAWPEKERIIQNHNNNKKIKDDNDLLVLDILGLALRVNLRPGVEFTVPVDGPFGVTVDLEIGSGGQIKYGWIEFDIPKVRIWYINNKDNKTQKVHIAIMARPSIVPNLNVNADRGKGDFFEMEFAGGGSFDDIIETILCSFGPSSLTQPDEKKEKDSKSKKGDKKNKNKNNNQTTNWVADALGRQISKKLSNSGLGGNKPLDIDLSEGIKDAIDDALGKPRLVEEIKADITALEEELKLAEQYEKEQENEKKKHVAATKANATEEEKKDGDMVIIDVDDDIGAKQGGTCSHLSCCGFGST